MRAAHLLPLFALGCSPELSIAHVQDYCTNYDFDDPPTSEVAFEIRGEMVYVYRSYALAPAGSEFAPRVTEEGRTLHVYEGWTPSTAETDLCFQPGLEITGLSGKLEVRWYVDESQVPYRTVEIDTK